MKLNGNKIAIVGAVVAAVTAAWSPARATEPGAAAAQQKPGVTIGAAAAAPPPGIYMFDQAFVYNSKLVGPGAPNVGGSPTKVQAGVEVNGFVFVPGWTFLGATYDAVIAQPFEMDSVGAPFNTQQFGMYNTFIAPIELSWKIADSGFFVKAGFGMYVPDGSISGPSGLNSVGTPWWTFQPSLTVSYLKDGWNLTANLFEEFHTASSVTGYTSGDVFHADLTATKRIGKWTFGPVGYYAGQVTSDTSSAFYGGAIASKRWDVYAAGALVGYDFGPASLNVWALNEFSASASGGTAAPGVPDTASVTKGWSVFASLSYRLWAPDEPAPLKSPLIHK